MGRPWVLPPNSKKKRLNKLFKGLVEWYVCAMESYTRMKRHMGWVYYLLCQGKEEKYTHYCGGGGGGGLGPGQVRLAFYFYAFDFESCKSIHSKN
jgi:hypothetical protein